MTQDERFRYSIVLPVRNGGEYVKLCVQSILSQSYTNFHLHILDNCSTDGTTEWLQSLKDHRIILHPASKSLGIVENWGRIKDIPRNEYMTMIGHDDLFDSNYLMVMDRLIQEHPDASLYQTHFRYINGRGDLLHHCLPMDEIQCGHEFLAFQFLALLDSTGTGYMMRSSDFDRMGGMSDYPNLIFSDYELWVKLSLKSYKATAREECFSYRVHSSMSAKTDGELYQRAFLKYMNFVHETARHDHNVRAVVDRYGIDYLYRYCEAMAHRLLKTKRTARQTSVTDFVQQCIQLAQRLIPGQDFRPMDKKRISLAVKLDSSAVGRGAFKIAKTFLKMAGKK